MSLEIKIAIVLALLAIATAAGLIWRARTGRAKRIAAGEIIDLAEIAAVKNGQPVTKFGERVTFLQFSSETPDVLHIEVDITNRLDLATKFNILQTPTTLVLDHQGRVTSRIGGAAKPQTIQEELGSFHI
jgi:hypothetical protein